MQHRYHPDIQFDPENILRKSFSSVGFGSYQGVLKDGILHTCAVPGLFATNYPYGRLYSRLQRAFRDTSVQLVLNPIQGHGTSREESAAHLLYKLVLHSMHGGLHRFRAKADQPEDVMVVGKPYWTVHYHQKEHDHESRRLIDFEFLEFNPFEKNFEALPFDDGYHLHLLDETISPAA